jgi:tetratricopeptide (TPR) repeat protein
MLRKALAAALVVVVLTTALSWALRRVKNELDHDNAIAYYGRGCTHQNNGDYGKAIADYTEAIRLNPNYTQACNNRGHAYSERGHSGDNERAINDFTEALRLNHPDTAMVYRNRGTAYLEGEQYDQAIVDFTAVIRLEPSDVSAYNSRGVAYRNKGDYDRAIADYDEAIRLRPEYVIAFHNRGNAYRAKGDEERAMADYAHEAILHNLVNPLREAASGLKRR